MFFLVQFHVLLSFLGIQSVLAVQNNTFLGVAIPTCPELSCQGLCFGTRSPDAHCHCDNICTLYGDCCYDYWAVCEKRDFTLEMKNDSVLEHLTCREIGDYCQVSLRMVNSCPRSFSDKTVSRYCSVFTLGHSSPVLGKSGYVFANKHCAQCHGETFDDLVHMPVRLECPDTDEMAEMLRNLTVGNDGTWFDVQITCHHNVTIPPEAEGRIRYCSAERLYKNRCLFDADAGISAAKFRELESACSSYQGFVFVTEQLQHGQPTPYTRQYRNIHCALCGGVDIHTHNVTCSKPPKRVKRQQCFASPGPITGPSFTVLLDFGRDFETNFVEVIRTCPAEHTYDTESSTCKQLLCDAGYVLEGGQCLPPLHNIHRFSVNVSAEFPGKFTGSSHLSKEVIGDLLMRHNLHGNFTYSNYSQSQINVEYNELVENASRENSKSGLSFCIELVEKLGATDPLREDTDFECSMSAQQTTLVDSCDKLRSNYGSFRGFPSMNTETFSVLLDEMKVQYSFFTLQISFVKRFTEVSVEWSTKYCPLDKLSCPLMYVNDSRIEVRNESHILLKNGQWYDKNNFQIIEKHAYVCVDYVQNYTVSLPLFTIQLGYNRAHYYMTVAGLSCSIAGLSMTLIVYISLEKLRTVPGKILMNLTLALLLAQFFFVFGTERTGWSTFCTVNAALEHYLWLVSFFWMNVISVDLAKTFMSSRLVPHDDSRSLLVGYCLFSWGLPLIHVLACVFLDIFDAVPDQQLTYTSSHVCFLSGYQGMLYAFVLPLTIIMGINVVCFLGVLVMLAKASALEKKIQKNRIKRSQLFIFVKLLPITGLTWIFGVIATFGHIEFLWNPFIIFNSLQGVFVFGAFVFNNRVKGMLRAKLSKISQESSGTSNTRF